MSGEGLDFTTSNLFHVRGKVAVVTGGGSGIGAMIASAYVQNGAKVYIASRNEKQLRETCETLNKQGHQAGSCHYLVADIGAKAGCDALANQIKERESKIHILVNNSGASYGAPYDNFPEKEGWDDLLSLNVKSVFYMTEALTPLLAKDATSFDPGRVINISSISSFLTIATGFQLTGAGVGIWSYGTSKAGLNHLTTLLATTLAPKFITVNAILPSVFPSKMTALSIQQHGEEGLADGNPFRRIGHPRDMAGVVLFLASPAAAYVSGTQIILDGATTQSRTKNWSKAAL
ncbi:NAD-P-binding protein [Lentinus brumalis]|uniref:NAD-P-binding protein n=1 Tax=Lentinus brumalis TaxID=2498619 RepID=A0A371DJ18_9APHY|nr:NAD-P-binding protein [Polyporus brumalis]